MLAAKHCVFAMWPNIRAVNWPNSEQLQSQKKNITAKVLRQYPTHNFVIAVILWFAQDYVVLQQIKFTSITLAKKTLESDKMASSEVPVSRFPHVCCLNNVLIRQVMILECIFKCSNGLMRYFNIVLMFARHAL